MLHYVVKRIALAVITFLGITLISFLLIHAAPGRPGFAQPAGTGGDTVSAKAAARIQERFHLDRPVIYGYALWLADLVRLDWGRSFRDNTPVTTKVAGRFMPTLGLCAAALIIAVVVAVPIGVETGRRAGSVADRVVGAGCFGLGALPNYLVAIVLIMLLGVRWNLLPFVGMTSVDTSSMTAWQRIGDVALHGVLICICLAYPLIVYQIRIVRAAVVEALDSDYILAARARGIPPRRLAYVHALRHAFLPMLTLVAQALPMLIGGTVILEVIFSWPGMGRLMFQAVMQRDYPVIMAVCTLSAVIVLIGYIMVDILYALLDPRVRLS